MSPLKARAEELTNVSYKFMYRVLRMSFIEFIVNFINNLNNLLFTRGQPYLVIDNKSENICQSDPHCKFGK